jgi:hypothetical protein
MDRTTDRQVVLGKMTRAELCPCAGSLVLSVGCVSLRLEPAAAEDLAATLMQALSLFDDDHRIPSVPRC